MHIREKEREREEERSVIENERGMRSSNPGRDSSHFI